MITKNGVLKLLDFGVARENMGYTCQYSDSRVGTNSHKAPELLLRFRSNFHKGLTRFFHSLIDPQSTDILSTF